MAKRCSNGSTAAATQLGLLVSYMPLAPKLTFGFCRCAANTTDRTGTHPLRCQYFRTRLRLGRPSTDATAHESHPRAAADPRDASTHRRTMTAIFNSAAAPKSYEFKVVLLGDRGVGKTCLVFDSSRACTTRGSSRRSGVFPDQKNKNLERRRLQDPDLGHGGPGAVSGHGAHVLPQRGGGRRLL